MEHLLYKDGLSVEKGLAICKSFFANLWVLIEPKLSSSNGENSEDIEIFCRKICMGSKSSAEWNEAIFRALKVPKEEQRDIKINPDGLFLCMMEFCRIYDKRYNSHLKSLLDLLNLMKQRPADYREEWRLLKKIIGEIGTRLYVPDFDWNAPFFEEEKLSVEQGIAVCTAFFMELWKLIETKLTPPGTNSYETHDLFCLTVCGESMSGPAPEGHAEWNEIIFRLKNIPKEQQKICKLTPFEVFLCMIEFCKLYNKKYELMAHDNYQPNLHFLLQLMESMKQDPHSYPIEGRLFKELIAEAACGLLWQPFDWEATFHEKKYTAK